jgi:hypothetical protein
MSIELDEIAEKTWARIKGAKMRDVHGPNLIRAALDEAVAEERKALREIVMAHQGAPWVTDRDYDADRERDGVSDACRKILNGFSARSAAEPSKPPSMTGPKRALRPDSRSLPPESSRRRRSHELLQVLREVGGGWRAVHGPCPPCSPSSPSRCPAGGEARGHGAGDPARGPAATPR